MRLIRNHFTYANVVATIALVLAVGGASAFAASKIGSGQLKASSVTAAKIRAGAVTEAKLRDGAISAAKLGDGVVTGSKLADGVVAGAKLANDAVTGAKVADGSLSGRDIDLRSLGSVPQADAVDGQTIAPFFGELASGGPEITLLEFGGVRLAATCPALQPVLLLSKTTEQEAAAEAALVAIGDKPTRFGIVDLGGADAGQRISREASGAGSGDVVFKGGGVTTIDFAWRNDDFAPGPGCRFFGRVFAG
jgi:hypothetical protein